VRRGSWDTTSECGRNISSLQEIYKQKILHPTNFLINTEFAWIWDVGRLDFESVERRTNPGMVSEDRDSLKSEIAVAQDSSDGRWPGWFLQLFVAVRETQMEELSN
jgi:hypothetical protein